MIRIKSSVIVSLLLVSTFLLNFPLNELLAYSRNPAEGAEPMGTYRDALEGPPISEIGFKASGGRSPVEEYGITVKEYPDKIVIRSFELWRREEEGGFNKETVLTREEYENLWLEITRYNVWNLSDSFEAQHTDAFTYEFVFLKNKQTKRILDYGLSEPKLVDIARFLDQLASSKLGFSLFDKRAKTK